MSTADQVRALALGLPETSEAPHHGFPSFRVGGKIIATLPDAQALNVMLEEHQVAEVLDDQEDAGAVEELLWGQRVVGVRVLLARADEPMLTSLLRMAWARRAPRRLQDGDDA